MVAQPGATVPNAPVASPTSQRPVAPAAARESPFSSPYKQHLVALISTSADYDGVAEGGTLSLRADLDVARLALSGTVTFLSVGSDTDTQRVSQSSLYAGYALVASKATLFRVLGGIDVWHQESASATSSPALGATLRWIDHTRKIREGLDAAALVSVLPFRQLEMRAGGFGQLFIFEAQLGWRFQLVDVPSRDRVVISGPYVALGTAF